jgi:hypothetical protein
MKPRKTKTDKAFEQAKKDVLWEWRGYDNEEYERIRSVTEKPISEILQQVFKEIKLDERLKQAEILNVWNCSISSEIREHAHPFGLKNGVLIIEVDSNVWLSELMRFRKQEILARLQAAFGNELIKDLTFRLA